MKINNSDLLAVAVRENQYPKVEKPEIAFAGRSNVGKSSLLNLITVRKKLARTSNSPGKTRTINFYSINDDAFRIVDLPGYGYAKVSKSVSGNWGEMIETYLKKRQSLLQVILLVDIRHKPSAQDIQMYGWMRHYGFGGIVVATKADKISKSHLQKHLKVIREALDMSKDDKIIPVSSLNKTGVEDIRKVLFGILQDR